MCSCNTALMTSQHLLQHCPLQDTLRKNVWPEDLALTEQLYGDLAALRRTATFVRGTNISVEVFALDREVYGDQAAQRGTEALVRGTDVHAIEEEEAPLPFLLCIDEDRQVSVSESVASPARQKHGERQARS